MHSVQVYSVMQWDKTFQNLIQYIKYVDKMQLTHMK